MKAATTAHIRMGKEFFSTIIRRGTVLVDIMIHQQKIKTASQQST
jgi:hypothetical protein